VNRRDTVSLLALSGLAPWRLVQAADAAPWDDQTWTDAARSRPLPVRWRWPPGSGPCGVVVYSHGLGGDRSAGSRWAQAWQAAGLAVINVQHPGSDRGIFSGGLPAVQQAVRQAGSAEQYIQRVRDAHFVLDELERRRASGELPRIRLDAIGFAGHSFGARLTQAVAGERAARGDAAWALDPRPRAFIAFSPGFDARGGSDDATAGTRFGAITRPFLCVTGTRDDAAIVGDASYAARRAVYRGLPAGQKAELLLAGADHMTFGGQDVPVMRSKLLHREPEAAALEPAHAEVVARISTDWWRWRLLGDDAARERLIAPTGLVAGDGWQQG
jgi:dienelactone hydrolase